MTSDPFFDHLWRLTDDTGLFEHARWAIPRREHGYCLDDTARALVVTARVAVPSLRVSTMADRYLAFVAHAQASNGSFHNRLSYDRRWLDASSFDDCWGRALWGLGTTMACSAQPWHADAAGILFDLSAVGRSKHRRAMAFAALGAAEALAVAPNHELAHGLLVAAAEVVAAVEPGPGWPWPEPRLSYANAVIPDALLAAGAGLGDGALVARGLEWLRWLIEIETAGDVFSVTPTSGWAPGEPRPAFDQQPIEVAALADACGRAYQMTDDPVWAEGVERAGAWFDGANDAGVALYDTATGGGCDGLHADGRNENQGAESTLALLLTLQQVNRLARPTAAHRFKTALTP